MTTARSEGQVGSVDEKLILRLPNEELVDVFSIDEDGDKRVMHVSYVSAQKARGCVGGIATLEDANLICEMTVLSASPDERFASTAPHHPGSGVIVGKVLA